MECGGSGRTARSYAPLTRAHLARLSDPAEADHLFFTRPEGRPEYLGRRLLVVLAQGGALHYLTGRAGVKDLDVWTFYAVLDGERFPADKRETHADFGPSELGRQSYDLAASSATQRRRAQRWQGYTGRRVDFLMRALPVPADASAGVVVGWVRDWLQTGSRRLGTAKPSAWHLAQKAMVVIDPVAARGQVVWPVDSTTSARS